MNFDKLGEEGLMGHLRPSDLFAFFTEDAECPLLMGLGYRFARDLNLNLEDLKAVRSILVCDCAPIAYELTRAGKLTSVHADEAEIYFSDQGSTLENPALSWRIRLWFNTYYRQRWLGVKIWCQAQDILKRRALDHSVKLKGIFSDIERRRKAWGHLSDFWLDSDLATAWAHQQQNIKACLDLGYSQDQILAIARFELHPVLCGNIWTWDGFDSDEIEAKIALYCLSPARNWFAQSLAKMYNEPIADIEAALKMTPAR